MSAISRLLLVGILAVTGCDKGPTAQAASKQTSSAVPAGQTLGAGVKLTTTTSIDELLKNPTAFKDKTVRVEGMILDVCPKRGCWMELAGSQPGQKLKFKVTDGEMVFPVDSKGKYVVAEGPVAVHELTMEQSREYAEEQASENGAKFDPASVTKPILIVRLDGTGAVMRDKK